MWHGGPPAAPGLRIGLLGGSFDPPHEGHVHITRVALRRLRLDRVWWLVTPGNPLKERGPADLARRIQACRAAMRHPRVAITDIESRLGTRYTADTLARLKRLYPRVQFVWLMGADNLASFHHWEHWDRIMASTRIAVLARPGAQIRAGLSPAAQRFARFRLDPRQAAALTRRAPPAWTLLASGPTSDRSSSDIRARGLWP